MQDYSEGFKRIMFHVLSQHSSDASPDRIREIAGSLLRENDTPRELWATIVHVSEEMEIADGLVSGSIDAESVFAIGKQKVATRGRPRKRETRIDRFANEIDVYVRSNDGTYEDAIRNEFGNTPDVSKALRMLRSRGRVVRSGEGGRLSPFSYRSA